MVRLLLLAAWLLAALMFISAAVSYWRADLPIMAAIGAALAVGALLGMFYWL